MRDKNSRRRKTIMEIEKKTIKREELLADEILIVDSPSNPEEHVGAIVFDRELGDVLQEINNILFLLRKVLALTKKMVEQELPNENRVVIVAEDNNVIKEFFMWITELNLLAIDLGIDWNDADADDLEENNG